MSSVFLHLVSHILFIYLAHYLLVSVVDWSKFLKGIPENQQAIQFFLVFVAIALGYIVSTFFLEVLSMGRSLVNLFVM